MSQIFPKWANQVPKKLQLALILKLVGIVFIIWYYFSPKFTEVGYMPDQPIPYSHKLHVGKLGIDCQYCHTSVSVAAKANIPSTETCMNCHSVIKKDSEKLKPLMESWETGKAVEWVKVHQFADYAYFDHSAHVNVGVGCQSCHGRIDRMEVVFQKEPLSMGWCLDCHRNPAPHLRPVEEVTNMEWVAPEDPQAFGEKIIKAKNIHAPTYCNGCHR